MLLIRMDSTIIGESLQVKLVQRALGWFNKDYPVQEEGINKGLCKKKRLGRT
jgi:hypothetical protein